MERQDVIKWLDSYVHIKKERDGILALIRELEDDRAASQLRSPNLDGMPHGTSLSDKTARLAAQLADAEEEIIELRSEAWSIRMEIVRTLNRIQSPEYNMLLYLRYIEGKTWEQIAVEMHYSIQHIYRMHDTALSAVEEILDSPRAKAIYQGFQTGKAPEELCRKCGYARRFG